MEFYSSQPGEKVPDTNGQGGLSSTQQPEPGMNPPDEPTGYVQCGGTTLATLSNVLPSNALALSVPQSKSSLGSSAMDTSPLCPVSYSSAPTSSSSLSVASSYDMALSGFDGADPSVSSGDGNYTIMSSYNSLGDMNSFSLILAGVNGSENSLGGEGNASQLLPTLQSLEGMGGEERDLPQSGNLLTMMNSCHLPTGSTASAFTPLPTYSQEGGTEPQQGSIQSQGGYDGNLLPSNDSNYITLTTVNFGDGGLSQGSGDVGTLEALGPPPGGPSAVFIPATSASDTEASLQSMYSGGTNDGSSVPGNVSPEVNAALKDKLKRKRPGDVAKNADGTVKVDKSKKKVTKEGSTEEEKKSQPTPSKKSKKSKADKSNENSAKKEENDDKVEKILEIIKSMKESEMKKAAAAAAAAAAAGTNPNESSSSKSKKSKKSKKSDKVNKEPDLIHTSSESATALIMPQPQPQPQPQLQPQPQPPPQPQPQPQPLPLPMEATSSDAVSSTMMSIEPKPQDKPKKSKKAKKAKEDPPPVSKVPVIAPGVVAAPDGLTQKVDQTPDTTSKPDKPKKSKKKKKTKDPAGGPNKAKDDGLNKVGSSMDEGVPFGVIAQDLDKADSTISCRLCNREFPTESALQFHESRYHTSQYNECIICNGNFKDEDDLVNHLRDAHTECRGNEYTCKVCGKLFNQRSKVMSHIKRHAGIQHFKCSMCDRKFFERIKMLLHTETHKPEAERNFAYKCDVCGKKFAYISALNAHKFSHTKEKPFACSYCPAAFCRRSTLKHHVSREHMNSVCPLCGQKFTTQEECATHTASHLVESTYTCCHCNKVFLSRTLFKFHSCQGKDGEAATSTDPSASAGSSTGPPGDDVLATSPGEPNSNSGELLPGLDQALRETLAQEVEESMGESSNLTLDPPDTSDLKLSHGNVRFLCTQCGITFKYGEQAQQHVLTHLKPDELPLVSGTGLGSAETGLDSDAVLASSVLEGDKQAGNLGQGLLGGEPGDVAVSGISVAGHQPVSSTSMATVVGSLQPGQTLVTGMPLKAEAMGTSITLKPVVTGGTSSGLMVDWAAADALQSTGAPQLLTLGDVQQTLFGKVQDGSGLGEDSSDVTSGTGGLQNSQAAELNYYLLGDAGQLDQSGKISGNPLDCIPPHLLASLLNSSDLTVPLSEEGLLAAASDLVLAESRTAVTSQAYGTDQQTDGTDSDQINHQAHEQALSTAVSLATATTATASVTGEMLDLSSLQPSQLQQLMSSLPGQAAVNTQNASLGLEETQMAASMTAGHHQVLLGQPPVLGLPTSGVFTSGSSLQLSGTPASLPTTSVAMETALLMGQTATAGLPLLAPRLSAKGGLETNQQGATASSLMSLGTPLVLGPSGTLQIPGSSTGTTSLVLGPPLMLASSGNANALGPVLTSGSSAQIFMQPVSGNNSVSLAQHSGSSLSEQGTMGSIMLTQAMEGNELMAASGVSAGLPTGMEVLSLLCPPNMQPVKVSGPLNTVMLGQGGSSSSIPVTTLVLSQMGQEAGAASPSGATPVSTVILGPSASGASLTSLASSPGSNVTLLPGRTTGSLPDGSQFILTPTSSFGNVSTGTVFPSLPTSLTSRQPAAPDPSSSLTVSSAGSQSGVIITGLGSFSSSGATVLPQSTPLMSPTTANSNLATTSTTLPHPLPSSTSSGSSHSVQLQQYSDHTVAGRIAEGSAGLGEVTVDLGQGGVCRVPASGDFSTVVSSISLPMSAVMTFASASTQPASYTFATPLASLNASGVMMHSNHNEPLQSSPTSSDSGSLPTTSILSLGGAALGQQTCFLQTSTSALSSSPHIFTMASSLPRQLTSQGLITTSTLGSDSSVPMTLNMTDTSSGYIAVSSAEGSIGPGSLFGLAAVGEVQGAQVEMNSQTGQLSSQVMQPSATEENGSGMPSAAVPMEDSETPPQNSGGNLAPDTSPVVHGQCA